MPLLGSDVNAQEQRKDLAAARFEWRNPVVVLVVVVGLWVGDAGSRKWEMKQQLIK